MTEKQYRLNKWATKLLKNDRPLFDWFNDSDEIVDLLNEQEERIKELLQDNDHKFWKHQFIHQFNSTSLIMHEISLAIDNGYEVSDDFKEYLDELKKKHEEGMKKANEQEKW